MKISQGTKITPLQLGSGHAGLTPEHVSLRRVSLKCSGKNWRWFKIIALKFILITNLIFSKRTCSWRNLQAVADLKGFQVAQLVKCLPAMQETQVLSLGRERSPGEGNGNPLQYSCLENSMDEAAWQATVHRVSKSWTDWETLLSLFHQT